MRTKKRWLFAVLGMLATCCICFACAKKPSEKTELAFKETSIVTDVYDVLKIETVTDYAGEIRWSSSDEDIAEVRDGIVVPKKPGIVEITAKAGNASATCVAEIRDSDEVPVVLLGSSEIALGAGESYRTEIVLTYKNNRSEYPIQWTCRGESDAENKIATAEIVGSFVKVNALSVGETVFTISSRIYDIPLVAELRVSVFDDDVSFASDTLDVRAGGFAANVGLIETKNDRVGVNIGIEVYHEGKLVQNPEISYDVKDNGAFLFDESTGEITAQKRGTGTITGTYLTNSFTVFVEAYRPNVSVEEKVVLETAEGNFVDLPFKPQGEDILVSLGGKAVEATISEAEDRLVFASAEKPKTTDSTLLEIETDKAIYSFTLGIYTKVLRTAQDIDNFGALSKAEEQDSNLWGGYFVLGNDIAYNKVFTPFISSETPSVIVPKWYNSGVNGFTGVFDGKGYTIDGMEVRGSGKSVGGFIGVLHTSGTIKNVSFTNSVVGAGQGFVCASCNGTIKNVYVHCVKQESGFDAVSVSGFFASRDSMGSARISNCFVDTTLEEGAKNAVGIGSIHDGWGILDGVYCVGTTNDIRLLSTAGGKKNVCGGFASYYDLSQSGVSFSAWQNDFWTVKNGLPVPKNSSLPQREFTAKLSSSAVQAGKTLAFELSKDAVISLGKDAVLAGCSLQGNAIVVPETAEAGKVFSVTVTSVFSKDTITLSFKIVDETTELPGEYDNIDEWGDETVRRLGEHDNNDEWE